MNVERYVTEKKIQHDVKGDDISDDELLLRRLKNFEKDGTLLRNKRQLSAPRVLDKPRSNELQARDRGYTVVLMSADQIFDPSEFQGLNNVDVFAIDRDKYMYCAGLFGTVEEASAELVKAQSKGFTNAYILRRKGGEFYSETIPVATKTQTAPKAGPAHRRNASELKEILNF